MVEVEVPLDVVEHLARLLLEGGSRGGRVIAAAGGGESPAGDLILPGVGLHLLSRVERPGLVADETIHDKEVQETE